MDKRYEEIINKLGNRVKINELMSAHTTFKIGGPADLYYEAKTEEELVRVLEIVRELRVEFFVLGGGSNVLVGDKGFKGIVINFQFSNSQSQALLIFNFQKRGRKFTVTIGAGLPLGTLVAESVNRSLTGLEFMAGIPGTVGGAVRGNAGAWQQSIGDKILRVKIIGEDGEIKWLEKKKCKFAYRESRFKRTGEIILVVELEMDKGDKKKIEGQVKENLEKRANQPKEPSAGCIFVNPKPQAAGFLIEEAGLRGRMLKKAGISEKHANFIVNLGGAKAKDVITLISLVKKKVKEKFGVDLEEEIIRIGEF